MANYYFVAASLPDLTIGQKPDITFDELENRLSMNLHKNDWKKVESLRRFTDFENIRLMWMQNEIDPCGNLSEKEIEESLLAHTTLPEYFFDFLDKYDTLEKRLRFFPALLSSYFTKEEVDGFLADYLCWERELRLFMVGLRSIEMGKDLAYQLQFEDPKDSTVAYLLAQKDSDKLELPAEFSFLKEIFETTKQEPLMRKRRIDQCRFDQAGELVKTPVFSIDAILAYLVQLMIVEYWQGLDREEGAKILQRQIQR